MCNPRRLATPVVYPICRAASAGEAWARSAPRAVTLLSGATHSIFVRCLLLLLLPIAPPVFALEMDLKWVESDVSLCPGGKGDVLYRIRYRVDGGEMHGFYFQGTAGTPVFDQGNRFAEPQNASGFPQTVLDIGRVGWDDREATPQPIAQTGFQDMFSGTLRMEEAPPAHPLPDRAVCFPS